MSQGGHIVKPSGRRKTWAIIYRDPAGNQQWEGKFKKRTEAQARLNGSRSQKKPVWQARGFMTCDTSSPAS